MRFLKAQKRVLAKVREMVLASWKTHLSQEINQLIQYPIMSDTESDTE